VLSNFQRVFRGVRSLKKNRYTGGVRSVRLEGGKKLPVFTTVLFVYTEGSIPEGSEQCFLAFWKTSIATVLEVRSGSLGVQSLKFN
jgi:hypothetical protein